MKSKLRLTVLIVLITAIFIQLPVLARFADLEDDSKYAHAANTLMELEIMYGAEDGLFHSDSSITRAEMVVILIRALGLERLTIPTDEIAEDCVFEDVPVDYWCVEDINLAYELGIIIGTRNKRFEPESFVSGAEAAKMIVNILGYSTAAEMTGGYPNGYIMEASKLGLTDGIVISEEQLISRGDMALMMYRALSVEIMEYSTGSAAYREVLRSYSGRTLASVRLGYEFGKGIVTANHYTSLTGESGIGENYVEIDGEVYMTGDTDAEELLGYYVEYYYKEGAYEEKVLMSVDKKASKNAEIVLDPLFNNITYKDFTYSYYEKNSSRKKTVSIGANTDIIYNGKAAFDCTDDEMSPQQGSIKLIDAECDGAYETVIITDAKNYVFAAADDNTIWAKDQKSINIKNAVSLSVKDSDGKDISLKELLSGDLFTAVVSKDMEIINIIVSLNYIDGTVSNVDDSGEIIVINGKRYELAGDLYCEPGCIIEAGAKGSFGIDASGRIAYYSASYGVNDIGYLVRCSKDDNIEESAVFKILSSNGDLKILSGAKKIKLNGQSMTADSAVEYLKSSGLSRNQVVRYKKNSSDEITVLNTKNEGTSDNSDAATRLKQIMEQQSLIYRSGSRSFGGKVILDNNAVIFVVPNDREEDMKYSVARSSELISGKTYTVDAYSIRYDSIADVIVMTESSLSASDDRTAVFAVITDISSAFHEDEGVITQLKLTTADFRESSYYFKDYDLLNGFDPFSIGDVVRITADRAGFIISIEKIYTAENGYGKNIGAFSSKFRVSPVYAYNMTENYLEVVPAVIESAEGKNAGYGKITAPDFTADLSAAMEIYPADLFSVMIYDSTVRKGNRLYKGTYKEICDYINTGNADLLIIQTRDGDPVGMFVVKNK